MNEQVLEDSVSRYGLRRVHVIGFDGPLDAVPWIEAHVPGDALQLVKVHYQEEVEIGVYHMTMVWNAREMIEFEAGPVRFGALWFIAKGERMGEAMDMAATLFRLRVGVYPSAVWAARLPDGAPEAVEVERIGEDLPPHPTSPPTPGVKARANPIGFRGEEPEGAGTAPLRTGGEGKSVLIPIREGAWVPERYVCAGIEAKDADVRWVDGKFEVRWRTPDPRSDGGKKMGETPSDLRPPPPNAAHLEEEKKKEEVVDG